MMIASWCRVVVDAASGKLSEGNLQLVEGHLVAQKQYLDAALAAIKKAREKLNAV